MKMTVFDFADTYIDSLEAFINTVDVTNISWYDDCVIVSYN